MPSISSQQQIPSLLSPDFLFPQTLQAPEHPNQPQGPTPASLFQDNHAAAPASQGSAQTHVSLVSDPPPDWSAGTKAGIKSSFLKGLQAYNVTPAELTQILRQYGISQLEITEAAIQDPRNAAEIEHIQESLNSKFAHPEIKGLNLGKTLTVDGQFGKNSVQAISALKDMWRGAPVDLGVAPIEQQTRTGCYRASEAMMFNTLHGKTGQSDAYTEFDFRDRVSYADRDTDQKVVGAKEGSTGRLSIKRSRGLDMLNEIDAELNAGRPVIAGVSYRKQNGREYNEGITDHFVTISGRGYDDKGAYYLFNDPADGGTHKFRFDPITGKLSGKGDMAGVYDVSLIAKANKTDEATLAKYEKLGKTLFYQGQRSPEIKGLQFQLSKMGYDTNGVDGGYGNGTYKAVTAFQEANQLPVIGNSVDNYTHEAIQAKFTQWQQGNPTEVLFKQGDSSSLLTDIQTKLTQMGFNTKGTRGSFGGGTAQAIRDFQTQAGINPTGHLDNQTWLAILQQAAQRPNS